MSDPSARHVVIMGGGPAGLTAAYQLCKCKVRNTVVEADSLVGGLAKTVVYKGYRFDIGGHRFFTKLEEVQQIWEEVLQKEFLTRSRLSRIFFRRKFLDYPLKPINILTSLGPIFCVRAGLSFLKAKLFPIRPEKSFQDWVVNRFGWMLYLAFFKSYTEKVWGIPCTVISADWAAQRIRGLSLWVAVKNALFKSSSKGEVKTLIEEFKYPRLGPGQMWEVMAEKITQQYTTLHMQTYVDLINWKDGVVTSIETAGPNGERKTIEGTEFISSIPLRELIRAMDPPVPDDIRHAAEHLGYRDFIIVALVVKKKDICPDNWIYVHDDSVQVGRIQNFKNWSPDLVPDQSMTCLGMEHFCQEDDALWTMEDDKLIAQSSRELEHLGLAKAEDIVDGKVVRVKQAYPVYDADYTTHIAKVREFLSTLKNLHLVGRNGMHKYNNQDHAMLSAMLVADNLMGAEHDVWAVNTAEEYHEEVANKE